MKSILQLVFLFVLSNLSSQSNNFAKYQLNNKVSNRILVATGELQIDKKHKISNFSLSQYENLISNNIKSDSTDIELMKSREICLDHYEYQQNFITLKSISVLYDYSCDTKSFISEPIRTPNWSISKENFIIGNNRNLKKATALINDRIWIVYYNPKIKVFDNIWRFQGLGGLVIMAHDESERFTFNLVELQKKYQTIEPINSKNIKERSYENFKKIAIDNYWDFVKKEISTTTKEPLENINVVNFPPYETLEFIEKRN